MFKVNRETYKVQLFSKPTDFRTTVVKLYLQPKLGEPNKELEEELIKELTKKPTKKLTKELTKKPTKELIKELVPNTPHQKSKRI